MPSRSKKHQTERLRRKRFHAEAVANETYLGTDEFGFSHYLGKLIPIRRDSDTRPQDGDAQQGSTRE